MTVKVSRLCELCTGVENMADRESTASVTFIAAQVIADISNVRSAKYKCQQTCKSTEYSQVKPKCCQVSIPP